VAFVQLTTGGELLSMTRNVDTRKYEYELDQVKRTATLLSTTTREVPKSATAV
jgi:hypothetical protein